MLQQLHKQHRQSLPQVQQWTLHKHQNRALLIIQLFLGWQRLEFRPPKVPLEYR